MVSIPQYDDTGYPIRLEKKSIFQLHSRNNALSRTDKTSEKTDANGTSKQKDPRNI